MKVAIAATMQSRPDISNSSMMDTSLDFHQPEDPREPVFERGFELKNETDSVYRQDLVLNAGGRGPSLQIQRDTNNVSLEFDVDFNSDQHFHVFTSEGVHLAGTDSITLAEANAMIGSDAGFGGGLQLNYLNQTGRDAYLDTAIGSVSRRRHLQKLFLSILKLDRLPKQQSVAPAMVSNL